VRALHLVRALDKRRSVVSTPTTLGRYRLLERLGRGGMAEVFKAKSYGVEGFEKTVAVKRILPELIAKPEFLGLFVDEARLAIRLSHANIVQVFDLGVAAVRDPKIAPKSSSSSSPPSASLAQDASRDEYFMVMEFVRGLDLASMLAAALRRGQHVPVAGAVRIVAEVAKALDYAHRQRDDEQRPIEIVHRDVSLSNVLVSFEGEVKLTDFGIARARSVLDAKAALEDTGARTLQGKYASMSPEQANGEPLDRRSDIFSLGIVLFELLTGVNPFSGTSIFETVRRLISQEKASLRALRPEVDAELEAIVDQALAHDRKDRYQEASKLHEALLGWLAKGSHRFGGRDLSQWLRGLRSDSRPSLTVQGAAPGAPSEGSPADDTVDLGFRWDERSQPLPLPRALTEVNVPFGQERRETVLWALKVTRDRSAIRASDRASRSSSEDSVPTEDDHVVVNRALEEIRTAVENVGAEWEGPSDHNEPVRVWFGRKPTRSKAVLTNALYTVLYVLRYRARGVRIHSIVDAERYDVGRTEVVSSAQTTALVGKTLALFANDDSVAPCVLPVSLAKELSDRFVFGESGLVDFARLERISPQGSANKLVGRQTELRTVGEALALASRGKTSVLVVHGEAGIGKTRFLQEVAHKLARGTIAITVHQLGSVIERGSGVALATLMNRLLGTEGQRRSDEFVEHVKTLGLAEGAASVLYRFLRNPGSVGTANHVEREVLVVALARVLGQLSAEHIQIVLWDGVEDTDALSWGLFRDAAARVPDARVLAVVATRLVEREDSNKGDAEHSRVESSPQLVLRPSLLEGFARVQWLAIGPLHTTDTEQLVRDSLAIDAVPVQLLAWLEVRAGGNPLYVRELSRMLLESRALTIAERRIVSLRLDEATHGVPATLRELIEFRTRDLRSEERLVLEALSVHELPMAAFALRAVLAIEAGAMTPNLDAVLSDLQRAELVTVVGNEEWELRSRLVRDVIAGAIPAGRRTWMHRRLAEQMETALTSSTASLTMDRNGAIEATTDAHEARTQEGAWASASTNRLAHHWQEAGEPSRAAHFFAQAAIAARDRSPALAADDFARAFAIAPAQDWHGQVHWWQAWAHVAEHGSLLLGSNDAKPLFTEAHLQSTGIQATADTREVHDRGSNDREHAGALLAAATIALRLRRPAEARSILARLSKESHSASADLITVEALVSEERFAEAHAYLASAQQLDPALGNHRSSRLFALIAAAQGDRAKVTVALAQLERSPQKENTDQPTSGAMNALTRARVEFLLGDIRRAIGYAENAIERAEAIALPRLRSEALELLAEYNALASEWGRAHEVAMRGRGFGTDSAFNHFILELAEVRMQQANVVDFARAAYERSVGTAASELHRFALLGRALMSVTEPPATELLERIRERQHALAVTHGMQSLHLK
jgi:serine/threonine protein kinase/tetratricopeptide (TPR) repeat protein